MRLDGARNKVVVVVLLGSTMACSLLLKTSQDQCVTDGDCPGRGAEFAGSRCIESVCVGVSAPADAGPDTSSVDATPDAGGPDANLALACLGDHPAPKPTVASATATWHFTDLLSSGSVTSIKIRLCPNASDPTCGSPAATTVPDATGHVTFDLDLSRGAFNGYIAIDPVLADGGQASTDPDGGRLDDEYVPTRFFYQGVPIFKEFIDEEPLFTYGTMKTFASLYKLEPPDPKLGITFVFLQDCQNAFLAGVTVDVDARDAKTLSFYFFQNAPALAAKATDESGNVGFINVPTGARRFSAQIAASQQPFGSVTLFSFPDTISIAAIGPDFTR
jgi:hypothetical protein